MGGCTQTAFDILKPSKRNKTAVIHRLCRKAGFKGLELQERVLLMCSSGKYRYQHTHPKEGYGNLRWKGGGGGVFVKKQNTSKYKAKWKFPRGMRRF